MLLHSENTMENLPDKLSTLIATIIERNKEIQAKKEGGPWGILTALLLALLSLVGIGVAMYLANRRSKELAQAKTELEQQKVDLANLKIEREKADLSVQRQILTDKINSVEVDIILVESQLKLAQQVHTQRQEKLKNLKTWDKINEA